MWGDATPSLGYDNGSDSSLDIDANDFASFSSEMSLHLILNTIRQNLDKACV